MKLNRKELRKIQYDFNSFANRLLQADFRDYTNVLKKFIKYIECTSIIFDYICGCGDCDMDIEASVKQVQNSYGRKLFFIGETDEEEVRNVYAILKYITDNNLEVHYGIATGYSSSNKFRDKVKGFNDRFVMVLIRHLERYLTKVGIDMGVDEKITYNVTVRDGQVIIATDGTTVNATNQIGIDAQRLNELISDIRNILNTLSENDQDTVRECLDVIEIEADSEVPRKSMLKTAINTLKNIKGVTEFSAAVAALAQFVGPMLH